MLINPMHSTDSQQATPNTCNAKTRGGGRCKRRPVRPGGRCNLHGGKSLRGIFHPNFRHGRFSTALPDQLARRFKESHFDPQILQFQTEIELLDARQIELTERLRAGQSDGLLNRLRDKWREFESAAKSKDTAAAEMALREIGSAINAGADYGECWEELNLAIARRATMVERELRRLEKLGNFIAAADVIALFTLLGSEIRSRVDANSAEAIFRAMDVHLCREPAGRPVLVEKNRHRSGDDGDSAAVDADAIDAITVTPPAAPDTPISADSVATSSSENVEKTGEINRHDQY